MPENKQDFENRESPAAVLRPYAYGAGLLLFACSYFFRLGVFALEIGKSRLATRA